MKPFAVLAAAALALSACTPAVTEGARLIRDKAVDGHCTAVAPELREYLRTIWGTTSAGNRIVIECAVDALEPEAADTLPAQ